MNRILYAGMGFVLLFQSFSLGADETHALDLYRQAEKLYLKKKYSEALGLYREALSVYSQEGLITGSSYELYGRGLKRQPGVGTKYIPSKRIQEIEASFNSSTDVSRKHQTESKAISRHKSTVVAFPSPRLRLKASALSDESGDGVLNAREAAIVDVAVENLHDKALNNIVLSIVDSKGVKLSDQFPLEPIEPQGMQIASISLVAEHWLEPKEARFSLQALRGGKVISQPLSINLKTGPGLPSDVKIATVDVRDKNGDERISSAEMIEAQIELENKGLGAARNLRLSLVLQDGVAIETYGEPKTISRIPPGKTEKRNLRFFINKHLREGELYPLTIQLKSADRQVDAVDLSLQALRGGQGVHAYFLPKKGLSTNVLMSDVDEYVPSGSIRKPKAVAVVIGNKNYKLRYLPPVKYAINDARMIRKYLETTMGYSESRILYREDADRAVFLELFGNENEKGVLEAMVESGESDVFVYYSGHGAPDMQDRGAYFVPVDANPGNIAQTGFSLKQFYRSLALLKAKNITVVLDTCFSGNSFGGFLMPNVSPAHISVDPQVPDLENVRVFMSASRNQLSTWYADKKHGMYTYFFLKGLSGKADLDQDGMLTAFELGSYVRDKVSVTARTKTGIDQLPRLAMRNNFVITRYD